MVKTVLTSEDFDLIRTELTDRVENGYELEFKHELFEFYGISGDSNSNGDLIIYGHFIKNHSKSALAATINFDDNDEIELNIVSGHDADSIAFVVEA